MAMSKSWRCIALLVALMLGYGTATAKDYRWSCTYFDKASPKPLRVLGTEGLRATVLRCYLVAAPDSFERSVIDGTASAMTGVATVPRTVVVAVTVVPHS